MNRKELAIVIASCAVTAGLLIVCDLVHPDRLAGCTDGWDSPSIGLQSCLTIRCSGCRFASPLNLIVRAHMKVRAALRTAQLGSTWLKGQGQFSDPLDHLQLSADVLADYLSEPRFKVYSLGSANSLVFSPTAANDIDQVVQKSKRRIQSIAKSRLQR